MIFFKVKTKVIRAKMVLKPNKVIMKQNVAYCALTMSTGEFRLLEALNDMKQLETMCSLEDRRSCGAVTSACTIRGISHQGVPCFSLFLLYCLSLAALGFSSLLRRLSPVVESRAPLSLQGAGFPLRWPLVAHHSL